MIRRIKKPISNKQVVLIVETIKKSTRFFAILGILGFLFTSGPMQYIEAKTIENELAEYQTAYIDNTVDSELSETFTYPLTTDVGFDLNQTDITNEVIEERTHTSKTFKKQDGTYEIALYDKIIHYEEEGELKQVDNSLVESDLQNTVENKSNIFKVKFPKVLSENKSIKLQYDKFSIDWSVKEINKSDIEYTNSNTTNKSLKELNGITQSLIYKGIQSDVDLEYIVSGDSVKENIILNSYISNYELVFEYKLKNLDFKTLETGETVIIDEDGAVVFSFEDFYMIDSNMIESTDVIVEYNQTGNKTYDVKIKPNDNWLRNAEYPVKIDPSIKLDFSWSTNGIRDKYVFTAGQSSTDNVLVSGRTGSYVYKSYIEMSLNSIPEDVIISYAQLRLKTFMSSTTVYNKCEDYTCQVNLKAVNQTSSFDDITSYSFSDVDNKIVDYEIIEKSDNVKYYYWDFTKVMKKWYQDNETLGIIELSNDNTSPTDYIYFNSEEKGSLGPVITIGYQTTTGLYDYWTYHDAPIGDAGTAFVSDYTGELSVIRNDYTGSHSGMPLSLSMFYAENLKDTNLGYGLGWRTNFDSKAYYDYNTNKPYLIEPSGAVVDFTKMLCSLVSDVEAVKHMTDCYLSEDGSRRVMTVGVNGYINLYTADQVEYTYNNSNLEYISDVKTGNYIDVVYNGSEIDYVIDHYSNKMDFTYSNGYLDYVTIKLFQETDDKSIDIYNQVEKIDYNYSYNSYYSKYELTEVIYQKDYDGVDLVFNPDNDRIVSYDYLSNGRMTKALSSYGDEVRFFYEGSYKVTKYDFYKNDELLGYIDPTYYDGYTMFQDHLGNKAKYTFDGYGHTVNMLDDKGNSTYFKYYNPFSKSISSPNFSMNHKLAESSLPQKTQINPVQNHSFELDSSRWNVLVDDLAGASQIKGSGTSTTLSLYGEQSGYISLESGQDAHMYQDIELDAGNYTVSGYIRTGTGTAHINITGNITGGSKSTEYATSEDWTYVEVDFNVLSDNSTIRLSLYKNNGGISFYDNIQIIDGFRDTRQNILYNQSFEFGTTGWVTTSNVTLEEFEVVGLDGIYDTILGDKHVLITGDPNEKQYIEETINTNDIVFDSYHILGAWINGNVTPNKYDGVVYNDRMYGFEVEIYNNTTLIGNEYFPFNSFVEDWQYVVNKFYVPNNATSIKIKVSFQGEGELLVDGLQLYQEALGTEYKYDDVGNVKYVITPESDGVITYDYQQGKLYTLDKVTDQNGNIVEYDYTTNDLVNGVKTSNVTTDTVRNDNNQVISVRMGEDHDSDGTVGDDLDDSYYENFTTYSNYGQHVSSTTNEFDEQVQYLTDIKNALLEKIIDENNVSTTYEYDKDGRVKSVEMDGSTNEYTYLDDNLIEIKVNGYTYKLFYDELDRLSEVKIGSGTGSGFIGSSFRKYVYDTDLNGTEYETSRISEEIFGNTDGIKFIYNEEDQVESVWFKSCETCSYIKRFEYDYNHSGDLTIVSDLRDDSQKYYDYDLVGRIEKITSSNGDIIDYKYDNAGNLNVYSYDIQTVEKSIIYDYHLDNSNQLDIGSIGLYDKTVIGNFTKDYIYETDQLRRLTNIVLTLGTQTINNISYEYFEGNEVANGNVSNRIKEITQIFGQTTHKETLTYNERGYIQSITDEFGRVTQYYYDNKGQLYRENNQEQNYTQITYYDSYGNINYVYHYNFFIGSNPISNQPKQVENYGYDAIWKDQLEMYQYFDLVNTTNDYTITYTYDDTGNLIYADDTRGSNLDTTFDWEGRSLLSYSNQTVNATYTYNENGIRTYKTVNGVTTTYFLDGTKVLYETDGTNKIYYTYDVDGTLISIGYNGIEYYYVFNILGDVTHLLDSNGNIVVEYKYDAWGNLDNSYQYTGIGAANPYRYRGYRYDSETNLYYLQSRFYNPETGRFINADGVLQSSDTVLGHNMYAYVNNNPVMFTDPSGYAPEWLKTAGIVGAIVGTVLVVAAITILTCGVGTATLAGAIAVGAAKGALIGAAIGVGVGATAGAVGSLTSGEEFGSSEFWSNTGYGAMAGFGAGALIGAISRGTYAGFTYSPPTFTSSGSLEKHFLKHGNEFNGLYSNSLEYQKGAQYVINNGKYVKQMNGYIRFFGSGGKANYAFVGLNNAGQITTYGIRGVSSLVKVIPWLVK